MPAHNSLWSSTLLTALLLGLGESGAIAQPMQTDPLIAQSSPFQSTAESVNNPYSSSVDPAPGAVSSAVGYTLIHVNPAVGQNETGDGSQLRPFQTITQALRSADPNSIVLLAPGVYSIATGELFPLLLKPGVTVQGNPAGRDRPVLIQGGGFFQSPSAAERRNTTILAADRAGLANVIVNNPTPGGHGLWIEAGSPIIRESQFVGSRNAGIVVVGRGTPIIQGNYFNQNRLAGLMITGPSQAEVRENLFEATGVGITVAEGATPRIISNRIVHNQDGLVIYDNARPELEANQISQNRRNRLVEFGAPAMASTVGDGGEQPTEASSAITGISSADQIATPANQGTIAANQNADTGNQDTDTSNQDTAAAAPNAVVITTQASFPDQPSTGASTLALNPIHIETAQNEEGSTTDEPIVAVNERLAEAEATEVEISVEESTEGEAESEEIAISVEDNAEAAADASIPDVSFAVEGNAEAAADVSIPDVSVAVEDNAEMESDVSTLEAEKSAEEGEAFVISAAPESIPPERNAPSESSDRSLDSSMPTADRLAPGQMAADPPSVVLPAQILPSTSSPAPPVEDSLPVLEPTPPTEAAPLDTADKRTDSPRFSTLLTRLGVTNLINTRSSESTSTPAQSEAIEIPVIGPSSHQTEHPLAIGSATSETSSTASAVAIEIPVIAPPVSGADLSSLPEIPVNRAAAPSASGRLQVPSSDIPIGSASGLPTISVSRAAAGFSEGPPAPPSRANTLGLYYRVIVAAEDEATQDQVRSLVPDAFRTQFDGQIVMQVGAYEDQAAADEQANRLIRNGLAAEVKFIR